MILKVTVEDVVRAGAKFPEFTVCQLAAVLGIHRRTMHTAVKRAVDAMRIEKIGGLGYKQAFLYRVVSEPLTDLAPHEVTTEQATNKAWDIMWGYWKACNKRYPVGAFPMRVKDLVEEDYAVVHEVTVAIMEGRLVNEGSQCVTCDKQSQVVE